MKQYLLLLFVVCVARSCCEEADRYTVDPDDGPLVRAGEQNKTAERAGEQNDTLVRAGEEVCRSPDGRSGVCVNIKTCPELLALLRTSGSKNREFLQRAVCGYEGFDPRVCCPVTKRLPGAGSSTRPRPAPLTRPQGPVPTRLTNLETSSNTVTPTLSSVTPDLTCGRSNASHLRVVDGVDAQPGAWPWLAALGYRSRDGRRINFLCGGALISAKHVLTAAHCVHNRRDLEVVRLGEHDLSVDDDSATDHQMSRQVVHPDYSPTTFENDIAIIVLSEPVTLSTKLLPICLPDSPAMRSMSFARKLPFVAGWGAIRFNGPSTSILQEVQLPVVDETRCKDAYANFRTTVIDHKVMCAGYTAGGKDACQGDSGGPLMWPGPDSYYVIGVVSYGFRCAEAGYPGVYSRVTHFLDWIESTVRNTN